VPTRDLSEGAYGRLRLTIENLRGIGTVTPRLEFSGNVRTLQADAKATVLWLEARLLLGTELLGSGAMTQAGLTIVPTEMPVSFQIHLSHAAITFIERQFRSPRLALTLQFAGMLWFEDGGANTPTPRFWGPEPSATDLLFPVPRSDWVSLVLEPLGTAGWVLLDFEMPEIPEVSAWRKAVAHVNDAERAYRLGQDPAVFSACAAAFESLGDPKALVATVDDSVKRARLDELVRQLHQFLHSGRHVSNDAASPSIGQFPVDHQDAMAALAMTKVLVSYLANVAPRNG
jgi:hypothetical protein